MCAGVPLGVASPDWHRLGATGLIDDGGHQKWDAAVSSHSRAVLLEDAGNIGWARLWLGGGASARVSRGLPTWLQD